MAHAPQFAPNKRMPLTYRISYEVEKPHGWQRGHVDYVDLDHAREALRTLQDIQAARAQPAIRNLTANFA